MIMQKMENMGKTISFSFQIYSFLANYSWISQSSKRLAPAELFLSGAADKP
jgi:hypothetical protein